MYAKRMKELRKSRGWTMEIFSEMIDVAKSSIAGYESGNRQPPIDRLVVIAEVFDTSTDYILGLTDDPDSKKDLRDVADFLDKDPIHYHGRPLSREELEPIKELLKLITRSTSESYCG